MKFSRVLGTSIAAAALFASAACGGNPADDQAGAGSNPTVVVGSASFGENEILAEIYAGALAAKGIPVETKLDIGAREAYIGAVRDGDIDLFPEYSGNLLQYFDANASASAPADVLQALHDKLPQGLEVLNPAPGQDKDSLNVTSEFARAHNLTSIEDLAKLPGLNLAANPEFGSRAFGLPGMERVYGFKDVSFTPINDGGGPATVKALTSGKVDMADVYSTTPSIAENHLVTLEDPKNLFVAENVIPLIRHDARSAEVDAVLNAVSAKLTTEALLELNQAYAGPSKPKAADVARDWLKKNALA